MSVKSNVGLTKRLSHLLVTLKKLTIDACNGTTPQLPASLKDMYTADMNVDSLPVQLSMLPYVVRTVNKDYQLEILKVTSMNTICVIFNTCRFPKTSCVM